LIIIIVISYFDACCCSSVDIAAVVCMQPVSTLLKTQIETERIVTVALRYRHDWQYYRVQTLAKES